MNYLNDWKSCKNKEETKNESCWKNWNFETERNKPIINKYKIIKEQFRFQTNHLKLKHSIQEND